MAQQQGLLTITGYVGGQPTQFNREGMPHASSFRLASTRHYFDGRTQQWKDLPTTWITVKAYRGLSESICQSFKKGEPVIVTGVLAAESWVDQNGKQQSKLVMEANAAGHDLSYGVSTFRKLAKKNDSGQQDAQPGQALGRDPYAKPPNSGAKLQSMRWTGRVPALTSKAARRPVRIATPPNPYVRNSAAMASDDCLTLMRSLAWPVTRCARVAPVRATCRRRAARQTPCGTGPHYGRCRSYGIRRGSAGRSADTAPPTRRDS